MRPSSLPTPTDVVATLGVAGGLLLTLLCVLWIGATGTAPSHVYDVAPVCTGSKAK